MNLYFDIKFVKTTNNIKGIKYPLYQEHTIENMSDIEKENKILLTDENIHLLEGKMIEIVLKLAPYSERAKAMKNYELRISEFT